MELASAVGANAITGLATWGAEKLYDNYRNQRLNKERLGPWHRKVFRNDLMELAVRHRRIFIFKMPSYEQMEKAMKDATRQNSIETPLGAVCWRGLLSKYVSEKDAMTAFAGENNFVQKDQVGAFKGNVAALANVSDMYKLMLSNVEPGRWKDVTLNKAERVTTIIGDFSMLYYDNAKWFHFVPSYNGLSPGRYTQQLKSLLSMGHTMQCLESFAIRDEITTNGSLIGCWMMYQVDGPWAARFQEEVFRHMLLAAENSSDSIFLGGVMTASKEYEVSRLLANVIHMALIQTVGGFFPSKSMNLNSLESSLGTLVNNSNEFNLSADYATFETVFLSGGSVAEICEMAVAASKIIVSILRFKMRSRTLDDGRIMTKSLLLAKSLKEMSKRLAVFDWNAADLEMLSQEAWLAGVDDTVTGDATEETEESTDEENENGATSESNGDIDVNVNNTFEQA